jgi:hypothetical protein
MSAIAGELALPPLVACTALATFLRCRRWAGVTCCATSAYSLVACDDLQSVASLSLERFGLQGFLPSELGLLTALTALALANNPALRGGLPDGLQNLPHLLWMSAQNTSLSGCAGSDGSCSALSPALQWTQQPLSPNGTTALKCPLPQLTSWLRYTQGLPVDTLGFLTSPLSAPTWPGVVWTDGHLTGFHNCSCTDKGLRLSVAGGQALCVEGKGKAGVSHSTYIFTVVLVAILPLTGFLLGIFIFFRCVPLGGGTSTHVGWVRATRSQRMPPL